MVVFEIKDASSPAATALPRPQRGKEVAPAQPVNRLAAVNQLLYHREWGRERKKGPRQMFALDGDDLGRVRNLTARLNEHLAACGILIHLVLIEDENGFALDVYDCSSGEVCQVIYDLEIGLDELPALLLRLQMEAGLMVDKVL